MTPAPRPIWTRVPLVVLASIAASLTPTGAAPAHAAGTEGPCTSPSGVTVVIDFQELGGGVHVRCAAGPVSSGFDALDRAGIAYQTTVRFPGFLCRIAGKPDTDPCIDASPASAYWSYWLAPRGGTWCYSNWGAGNRTPPPGTVEGWSFSLDKTSEATPAPRTPPPAPLAGNPPTPLAAADCDPTHLPTPPTTTRPPSPPTSRPPSPTSPAPPTTATGGVPPSSAPPATDGGTSPTGPTGSPTSPGEPTGGGDSGTTTDTGPGDAAEPDGSLDDGVGGAGSRSEGGEDDVALAPDPALDLGDPGTGSGSPTALLVGAALIAAVAGAGWFTTRRRRPPATGDP